MRILQRIWNDLRSGENLDSYLTVIVALVLAGINLFNGVPENYLASITLAALGTLAITTLRNRHSIEGLFEKIQSPTTFPVLRDQLAVNEHLLLYMKTHHVQQARLIEYDGGSIRPVVLSLLESGTKVHLLLQHPESAISPYQKTKILHQISSKDLEYASFPDLITIDYYKDIASFRGRSFGSDLICVGWYTYDRRVRKSEPEIWGHTNPALIMESTDKHYACIRNMFDTVFDNFLKNSESFDVVKQRYIENSSSRAFLSEQP